MIQWVGLSAFTASTWVQSLVGELRSHKLCGMAKKKGEKEIPGKTKCVIEDPKYHHIISIHTHTGNVKQNMTVGWISCLQTAEG